MPGPPSLREWYCCDNYISDRHPGIERDGHPLTGLAWLAVLNPGDAAAAIALTAYFAERPPAAYDLIAPPRRSTLLELHRVAPALPRNEPFGLRLVSDRPVVAQATQFEFRAFERLPEAAGSQVLYPGPLTDEREWYFADGYTSVARGQRSWFEQERLYVLNPGQSEARIDLTLYSEREASSTQYWVGPERLHTLAFETQPGFRWRRDALGSPSSVFFSVRLRSTTPVVVQKTRRDYVRFDPTVQGMWTTIGCPAAVDGVEAGQC
jgi:hypothetical protein